MKFVDIAKIFIKAGDGGNGHISFRREKFVPKGGPDGGNGGKGGDVLLKVDPHLNTLLDFKYKMHYNAENGREGGKSRKTGKSGKDTYIRIPPGTVVKDSDTEEIIADLTEKGQEFIAARGGRGGLGNSEFATPTKQAPRYATDGKKGEEKEIILELKLIADIGIIGFPNVGKSTLISVISAAKPRIDDYPFTTLVPNLGIVKIGDWQSFTVADIPGLIEGAHEGKGLGIQFLRHIERTKALVYLIDAWSADPVNDYNILCSELEKYNPEMKNKERFICISKIDSVDEDKRKELSELKFGKSLKPVLISSVTGESIDKVKHTMWDMIQDSEYF